VAYLLPIALWHKQLARVHWRRDAKWFVLLMLSSGLTAAPLYYATLHSGVGLATTLSYAGIVLGLFFFGWLFSRERYTKDKFISTVLGFVGLWLIFSPTVAHTGIVALAAALLSGFAVALNVAVTQKIPYNASQSTLLAWISGIVINVPVALLLGQKVPGLAHVQWLYLFIFAAVSLAASWTVIRASKLISAGAVGILGLLEVVFGVLFGVLFFGERPSLVVYLGMITIVAAATVPYVQHFKLKDEPFVLTESDK
jgi:drug/metabolite transporter (DMT)-like permease